MSDSKLKGVLMRRLLPFVFAAVLLGTACAADETAPEATPTPQDTPAALASCANPEGGFTVSYPADWETNAGEVMPACSVFHPEPFTLEPATEIPAELAVVIRVESVDFEVVASPDPEFEREVDREQRQVDGRTAVRLETEASGQGLYPEGTLSYRWLVDLNGETLVAISHDVGDLDYEEKKETLDRMMETIELPADGSQ